MYICIRLLRVCVCLSKCSICVCTFVCPCAFLYVRLLRKVRACNGSDNVSTSTIAKVPGECGGAVIPLTVMVTLIIVSLGMVKDDYGVLDMVTLVW